MLDSTIPIAVRNVLDCSEPRLKTVRHIDGDLLAREKVSHILLDEFSRR